MLRLFFAVLAVALASGCAMSDRSSGKVRLRVLTYNIHHGEGIDGKLDLERIARVIVSVQPDLVALQEVDQRATRSERVDQAAELGRLTGMHAVFGAAMPFQGGSYGQAILSRWPIISHQVHQLPQQPEREPRIALAAEVRAGDKGPAVRFIGTHLDHELEPVRALQTHKLNELFAETAEPSILLGDFNSRPGTEPMNILLGRWTDAAAATAEPTIPARNPRSRIDYILLRPPPRWRVVESRVVPEAVASDHRPVLAVVELWD